MGLHPIDWTILLGYFAAVLGLGVWMGRGSKTLADFTVGEKAIPTWVVLLSIVATETSVVSVLSVPGLPFVSKQAQLAAQREKAAGVAQAAASEGGEHGGAAPAAAAPDLRWVKGGDLTFLQLPIGYAIGRLLVVLLLMPLYFRGNMLTAYEVLEKRFGPLTRRSIAAMFLVTRTIADGLRLYLAALALNLVLPGWSPFAAIGAIGLITIVYTCAGGVKAIVWADVLQFGMYIGGALLACWLIGQGVDGGWSGVFDFAKKTERLTVFDFSFNLESTRINFWAGVIGGAFLTFATHGVDQLMVQRYLSARGYPQAATALLTSGVIVMAQFALFLTLGLGLACFLTQHPPVGVTLTGDRAFPYYIVHYFPRGAAGFMLAAIFAAAMTSLSGSLNSSATTLVNDFYLGWMRRGRSEDEPGQAGRALGLTRLATVFFGFCQMGVAMIVVAVGTDRAIVDQVLAIAALTTGVMLGVFLLGIGRRPVSERAALAAVAAVLALLLVLKLTTSLHFAWYAVIGPISTWLIGQLLDLAVRPASAPTPARIG